MSQNLIGPDRTEADDRRARARHRARVNRLRHGEGIGTVTVTDMTARIGNVAGIGPMEATLQNGTWFVTAYGRSP